MAVFLDTETTGLSPGRGDSIVEVAIVDGSGRALIDTLVNPGRPIPWQASNIHGITNDMVRGKPTLAQVMPRVLEIVEAEQVVIYNARFDAPFFPGSLRQARSVECAMLRYAEVMGGGRWQKLEVAARQVGHRWSGQAHRALADALACRSVWEWLEGRAGASGERTGRPRVTREAEPEPRQGDGAANGYLQTVVRCPNCQQRARVPRNKQLDVTCPGCRRVFRVTT